MSKKGFTIVEILVAVIILGIIAAIAVPTYININNAAKDELRANKIKQIELAAEKWADGLNLSRPITIPILQLIQNGYLSADEGSTESIIDPKTNKEMKCHTIDITFENYVPSATYKDTIIKDCKAKLEEENDENIEITAHTRDGKILKLNDDTKEYPWTNEDVTLIVTVNSTYKLTDGETITFSGSGINETKTIKQGTECNKYIEDPSNCYNAINVSGNNIIATIYTTISTDKGLKSKEAIVKIDKEAPTITSEVVDEDRWVNYNKTVKITGSDGNIGSGIVDVKIDGTSIENFTGSATVQKDNGIYEIIVTDHAGNLFKTTFEVDKIDKTPPKITSITSSSVTGSSFIVNISATDETAKDNSGLYQYNIYLDNKLYQTIYSEEESIAVSVSGLSMNTEYTVKADVTDIAGNISESSSESEITVKTKLDNYTYVGPITLSISRGITPHPGHGVTINSTHAEYFTEYRYAKIYWSRTSYANHNTSLDGDSNLRVAGVEIDSNPNDRNQNTLKSGVYTLNISNMSSFRIHAYISSNNSYTSVEYKISKIEFIL